MLACGMASHGRQWQVHGGCMEVAAAVVQRPLPAEKRWATSRKTCNRENRALRGNIKVVVANVGALSNLHVAVRTAPDVVLAQELWASAVDIRREAKFGFVAAVAVAAGSCCMSAILYRPGRGQQIHLPLVGEFS